MPQRTKNKGRVGVAQSNMCTLGCGVRKTPGAGVGPAAKMPRSSKSPWSEDQPHSRHYLPAYCKPWEAADGDSGTR